MPHALSAIAIAVLLVAAPAAAQRTVDDWVTAASTHRPGTLDEPAVAISRWTRDATLAAVDRAGRDASVGELAKGLVLHTDLALHERANGGGAAVGAGPSVWLLDTERVATLRRTFHWEAGRRLATALARRPQGAPIARAWFRAIAALLQQWGDFGAVRVHLDQASDLFPDDPVLLLYRGTLHQAYADARVQGYLARQRRRDAMMRGTVRDDGDGDPFGQPLIAVIKPAGLELEFAEGALRRAMTLDPTLVEARLRLAHVLGELGKAEESVTLARAALATPLPPFLDYYGAMVLGRNEARLGRAVEARAAFARASGVFPHAQSARVASSANDLAAGRAQDALASMMAGIGPGAPPDRNDPWTWCYRVHEPQATELVTDLRARAR
jgi:tetratricopeptide (TPR) repeat protein